MRKADVEELFQMVAIGDTVETVPQDLAQIFHPANGHSSTQVSHSPPVFRNSTKNGNCPNGVIGAPASHLTWIVPPYIDPTASAWSLFDL